MWEKRARMMLRRSSKCQGFCGVIWSALTLRADGSATAFAPAFGDLARRPRHVDRVQLAEDALLREVGLVLHVDGRDALERRASSARRACDGVAAGGHAGGRALAQAEGLASRPRRRARPRSGRRRRWRAGAGSGSRRGARARAGPPWRGPSRGGGRRGRCWRARARRPRRRACPASTDCSSATRSRELRRRPRAPASPWRRAAA